MTKKQLTESFEDIIAEDLCDDEYAVMYLNMAMKDSDPRHFLLALRRVAKARDINISELSRHLDLNRRGLYHALSDKGNPGWMTLRPLLEAMGYQIELKKA